MSNFVGGSIVWNLDVNASEFDKKISDATSKAKSAGKEIEESTKSIASSTESSFKGAIDASNRFAIGLAATATASIAVISKFTQMTADTEMLRTNIDIMAGSVEEGGRLYRELYDFAAKTPFETTDLVRATQTMLGYGISAQDATKDLKVLGDISLGNKDKLGGITYAYSQIMSTGRLLGQDLRQLINNGFNPLSVISKKTGKSMSELKGEMENGAISADMVRQAFYWATEQGGLFYKGMEKGSKTLTGVWSTMMDGVNTFIRSLVGLDREGKVIEGSFFAILKKSIVDITKIIKDNTDNINKTLGDVIKLIIDNLPIIIGIIVGGLTPAFIGLGVSIWAALAPLLPFMAAGVILALIIDTVIKQLGGWEEAQKKLNDVWEIMVGIYNTYFKPVIDDMWKTIQKDLLPALKELWDLISPTLIPALKTFAIILGVLVVGAIFIVMGIIWAIIKVITLFVEAWVWSIKTIEEWKRTIDENIKMIWNAFQTLPGRIWNAMSRVFDAITSPFRDAWNYIERITRQIREALDRINPFHRESPSLVDNVTSGVKEIRKQYARLQSIEMPAISTQSMPYSNLDSGTFDSGDTINRKDVVVNVGEINNAQDIDMISREIGYRFSLL